MFFFSRVLTVPEDSVGPNDTRLSNSVRDQSTICKKKGSCNHDNGVKFYFFGSEPLLSLTCREQCVELHRCTLKVETLETKASRVYSPNPEGPYVVTILNVVSGVRPSSTRRAAPSGTTAGSVGSNL